MIDTTHDCLEHEVRVNGERQCGACGQALDVPGSGTVRIEHVVDAIRLNWPVTEREFAPQRRALAEHFASTLFPNDSENQHWFIRECLEGLPR